jgi:hypothetical protein
MAVAADDRWYAAAVSWAEEALAAFDRGRLVKPDGSVDEAAQAELAWIDQYLAWARAGAEAHAEATAGERRAS